MLQPYAVQWKLINGSLQYCHMNFPQGWKTVEQPEFVEEHLASKKAMVLSCLKSADRDTDGEGDILFEGGSEIIDLDLSPIHMHCAYFF